MLYIPKIGDYLKVLTGDKLKDFQQKILENISNLPEKSCILN